VLDLGGDVRDNPRLSGTRHNVFGITVGVAITLLVRRRTEVGLRPATLRYSRVGEYWTRREKLDYLQSHADYLAVPWRILEPDERGNWLTSDMGAGFDAFMPLGSKQAKQGRAGAGEAVFQTFSLGVNTNRDSWVYGFSREQLLRNVGLLVDTYNGDLGRWMAAGRPGEARVAEGLVTRDETRIKWSSRLTEHLLRGTPASVHPAKVRRAMYRPFASRLLYFGPLLIHRPGHFDAIYPTSDSERENLTICVTDAGSEKPFMVLATNRLTDLHLVGAGAGTQCFPLYVYGDDGHSADNVGRAALAEYRRRYGPEVSTRDVFDYVYAILHSGEYRSRFGENLKRQLPRIPFVGAADFPRWVQAGHALVELHVGYECAQAYPLEECFSRNPMSYRVERMKLSPEKDAVIVNGSLTLRGVPLEVFRYELGGRSALEWVLNQYQVRRDTRSGIVSDPNDPDDPQAIVQLVKKVVSVSLETMRMIDTLPPLAIVS
jgi:predicted helicase